MAALRRKLEHNGRDCSISEFGQERSLAGEEKGRWKLAAQLPKNQKMYLASLSSICRKTGLMA
jgi:hypothetical protein